MANALDLVFFPLGNGLEPQDRALGSWRCFDRAGSESELATAVRGYLSTLPNRPDEEAWWEVVRRSGARRYEELASDPRIR